MQDKFCLVNFYCCIWLLTMCRYSLTVYCAVHIASHWLRLTHPVIWPSTWWPLMVGLLQMTLSPLDDLLSFTLTSICLLQMTLFLSDDLVSFRWPSVLHIDLRLSPTDDLCLSPSDDLVSFRWHCLSDDLVSFTLISTLPVVSYKWPLPVSFRCFYSRLVIFWQNTCKLVNNHTKLK